ncbi:MAG: hypothetical protein CBC35_03780 [Planctomycetes bacterium TMED75]|nr:gamma-glutamyl-gamma-aminobutyrate hydrolase [Planctomycetaceae bacterium]OUU94609.1 MAG: hypothetical protein CBC35_03780 [Planctomycetes bacterium TMED75]
MSAAAGDVIRRPVIGLSVHMESTQYRCRIEYAEAIEQAGGTPLMLPLIEAAIPRYLHLCDGFVTTGGDDPIMESFGSATHPEAQVIERRRQEFEVALLDQLVETPHPLLAICLGMQLFTLHAGGALDQHLPDSLPTADEHWDGREHEVTGLLGTGVVHSHHRQAITDPGRLEVTARAHDGVIEAVRDPLHHHRHGVQWHPERTKGTRLGTALFTGLVAACSA